ncbi:MULTISPECIES: class I SAM-dependent methyltransferase [Streptomycetaceae]|uniref:Methyltransferase type 11 n=1 Tax=Streptantibioticus cattleyicolor (strain ATCC 35852 / DSM 46488 / JCM 4925 / NBRC 14057 / NRRL 8057) TaxID=1003195 RepID=F8JYW6_STREN|nr:MULTISPECIES: class I SAM-dependent methyltransferase [Streptomycetaceae]AEW93438.1 methyltransferase type 11 [Streptantibioticus cattleyicolor NRRL 8057 = DSM 46488]MYS58150.1 methyltransferase domain-containing protein [Streptomyces sp. SID5468]CCB73792.1 putative enzyme [Streptantibioticus cattleyicolor NRRL 8057 = DSM 46488]
MTSQETGHTRRASSFGGSAGAYADHRPDYPQAAVAWALRPLAGRPSGGAADDRPHLLDLGAGTGKLTGVLLRTGHRVTAVEPDPQMADELRRREPGVPVLAGRGEEIPLPDGSVDAVLIGQAFHWFDPRLALPEIARVLTQGGVLAGLWNADDDRVPWVAGLAEVSGVQVSFTGWPEEPMIPGHPSYTPVERGTFPHAQRRTADSLTATLATHSRFLVLPAEERRRGLERVRDYLGGRPETACGEFELPLVTLVERCVIAPG